MLHPAHAAALLSPRGLLSFVPCGQRRPAYPLPLHPLGPGLVHHCPPMPIIPPACPQSTGSPSPAPGPAALNGDGERSSFIMGKSAPQVSHANSFVKKLYHMVTTRDQDIISFTPDGQSFHVKDPKRLEQEVLPHYFRHSRFQSLVRQLNFYNFKKTSKERVLWIYTHPLFQRDRPDLLDGLKRKPSNTLTFKAFAANTTNHTGFSRSGRCIMSSASALAAWARDSADLDAAAVCEEGDDDNDSKAPASSYSGRPTRSCRRRRVGLPLLRPVESPVKTRRRRTSDAAGSDSSEQGMQQSTDDEHSEGEGVSCEDGTDESEYRGRGRAEEEEEDEEEDDELDGLIVMEVGRGEEDDEDDEEEEEATSEEGEDDEDASAEGQAPVLLMLKRQPVLLPKPSAPMRRPQPPAVVDLSPYQPTPHEVAAWDAVRERWVSVVGDHGDDVLYLGERLPASHLDLCLFFLHLSPFSTTAEQSAALRELLETKPSMLESVRAHYHALDPSFPVVAGDRSSLFKPSQHAEPEDTPAAAAEAAPSAEVSSILRALMADGLNHLKEAVATLDLDDAARQPMEEALGLWMQHANRFF